MIFPATVLHSEIDALLGYLPLVRDGDVGGVHDARVTTRRLRETLPLFARSFPDDVRRVTRLVRSAGRKLGRVRELDVMAAELKRRSARMPMAQHAISSACATLGRRQESARRRLVKTLDRLRLERRDQFRLRHRRDWWHPFDHTLATGWAAVLGTRIAHRARDLRRGIDHAGGVYFPKRLHAVRVAAKKLRYSAELAIEGGVWDCDAAIADVKRTQDILGRLHDAEVLLDSLGGLVGKADVDDREIAILTNDLQGEIAERHTKYLAQRERLREAQQQCLDAADRLTRKRRPMLPVLALWAAVPASLVVIVGARSR
jgi:CHAD domain-containing protein